MSPEPTSTGPSGSDSAPRDKRKLRHGKKRQAYLDEAMGLVVQEGMEGLTIARLAARMHASVGAVYRYFPSKEALLVGLQEMAIADFHGFLLERLRRCDKSLASTPPRVRALGRIMVAFGAYLEHGESSPRPHRLVDAFLSFPEAILSDGEARAVGDRLLAPILDAFAGLLAAAVAEGALDPGDDAQRTRLAWAWVHGLDHFHKLDRINPDALRLKALLPLACAAFLRGLGARPEDVAAAQRLL
jgi:AcrR family transcriptional regulator